jgi:hypothetical protein
LGLYLSDGRQFHFRPYPKGHEATEIEVLDKYRVGDVVIVPSQGGMEARGVNA